MQNKVIGISGYARAGKDTFFSLAKEILLKSGINSNRIAFADCLKSDLDQLIQDNLGFSSFTEKGEEKEIIRPLLVCFGSQVMRKLDDRYWIRKLSSKIKLNSVNFITDVRYPNEVEWIQEELNGVCVNLERTGYRAINSEEAKYGPQIKSLADTKFKWEDLNSQNKESYMNDISNLIFSSLNHERKRVRLNFNQ
jgi:hypothetical protein